MGNSHETLGELLRDRAREHRDRTAYTFLADGVEVESLTYGALDRRARAVAARLRDRAAPGERALLLLPAGLGFLPAFFGCVYAGLIAIPAPAPEASRLKRTLPRLAAIARDARASLVISTRSVLDLIGSAGLGSPELIGLQGLDIGTIASDDEEGRAGPAVDAGANADALAYLQYTSGSTRSPKGVMLSHRNVLRHCAAVAEIGEYGPDSISLTWLPHFHDYGLIEGLLVPLANGTPCFVMSPLGFLRRPLSWMAEVSRHRATHTQAPNFAYDLCARRARPDQVAGLDLRGLRSAGNGAEPINPRVLERFARAFAPAGFRREAFCPAYGLAEATLMASCCSPSTAPRVGTFDATALKAARVVVARSGDASARAVASCGRALRETEIAIVDPERRTRCAPEEVGEVWVSAPGVARGYWERAAETDETFHAHLAGSGEGPFLRTGDLGFLHEGELYITGRLKDLIIIAGANHAPQDLEWTIERCHPAVRPGGAAAFAVMRDGEEWLAVAVELERGAIRDGGADDVFDAIRGSVAADHEAPVGAIALVARGGLPRTASGKLQRGRCAEFLEDGHPDVHSLWVSARARPAPAPSRPDRLAGVVEAHR